MRSRRSPMTTSPTPRRDVRRPHAVEQDPRRADRPHAVVDRIRSRPGSPTFDVFLGTSLDLSGQEWRRQCPATTGPSARYGSASAYDDANDRLILFGGQTAGGEIADVWVLENATGLGGAPRWTQVTPNGGPGAPARGRSVLRRQQQADRLRRLRAGMHRRRIGRLGAHACERHRRNPGVARPAGRPGARFGHAAGYDSLNRRLIVFGGSSGANVHSDVWLLRDATGAGTPGWDVLAPGSGPSPREGASAVYHASSNRLLVFGGREAAGTVSNQTWTLAGANGLASTPAWSLLATQGTPPAARWVTPRSTTTPPAGSSSTAARARASSRARTFVASDALVLVEEGGTPTSGRLEPVTGLPPARFLAAAAYAPGRTRFVVVGGRDNRATPPLRDDVWSLSDPIGRLPLVSEGQAGATFVAPTPDLGATTGAWWTGTLTEPATARRSGASCPTSRRPSTPGRIEPSSSAIPSSCRPRSATTADPSGGDPLVAWTRTSGPASMTFTSPESPQTLVQFVEAGTYVLRVTADDGAASASDELTVTVLPVPTAGRDLDHHRRLRRRVALGCQQCERPAPARRPGRPVQLHLGGRFVEGHDRQDRHRDRRHPGRVPHLAARASRPDSSRTTVDRRRQRLGRPTGPATASSTSACGRPTSAWTATATARSRRRAATATSCPWPNTGGADTNGGVSTAADECIIHYTRVTAGGTPARDGQRGQRRLGQRHSAPTRASSTSSTGPPGSIVARSRPSARRLRRPRRRERRHLVGRLVPAVGRYDLAAHAPSAATNPELHQLQQSMDWPSTGSGNIWNTTLSSGKAVRKFSPDGDPAGTVHPRQQHSAQGLRGRRATATSGSALTDSWARTDRRPLQQRRHVRRQRGRPGWQRQHRRGRGRRRARCGRPTSTAAPQRAHRPERRARSAPTA